MGEIAIRAIFVVVLSLALASTGWARGPVPGEIEASRLPPEAARTLVLIKQGGPYPYRKDGSIFRNREQRLPIKEQGYYREFTVPTPGAKDRGARRIVAGRDAEYYYTEDHYNTFLRIRE